MTKASRGGRVGGQRLWVECRGRGSSNEGVVLLCWGREASPKYQVWIRRRV